jgi:RNA polymerase sigma factor (sigma-70 family)
MRTPTGYTQAEQDALLAAAKQGDSAALEAILLAYQPMLIGFARKYCATPQDVEDAVQETLWVASKKIGGLRVSAAVVAWLFRIVRHQCFRLLRLDRHTTSLDSGDDKLALTSSNPDAETDLKNDLIAALARLPLAYREVVLLRDVQGLTAPEAAAILGVSIDAIKARLARGRQALREMLSHWQTQ